MVAKLTAPPMNTIDIDGSDVKIGYNMALTLNPTVQNNAQQVADCVTNSPNATVDCSTVLSPTLQNVASQMYENALVRSIGIALHSQQQRHYFGDAGGLQLGVFILGVEHVPVSFFHQQRRGRGYLDGPGAAPQQGRSAKRRDEFLHGTPP